MTSCLVSDALNRVRRETPFFVLLAFTEELKRIMRDRLWDEGTIIKVIAIAVEFAMTHNETFTSAFFTIMKTVETK